MRTSNTAALSGVRIGGRPSALPDLPKPDEWVEEALCAQCDPEMWWPGNGDSTELAVAICNKCPVSQACLQYSIDHSISGGIWGGLRTRRRNELRLGKVA